MRLPRISKAEIEKRSKRYKAGLKKLKVIRITTQKEHDEECRQRSLSIAAMQRANEPKPIECPDFVCPHCVYTEFEAMWSLPAEYGSNSSGTIEGYYCVCCSKTFDDPRTFSANRDE